MMQTLHAAAEGVRQGRVTPVDLVRECLAQIDKYESRLKAWVLLDREGALADAERLTAELKKGHWRGPLHGMPIGVKDIFDVFDWPTAAGSRLWSQSIARRDCTVIERLRKAGAIFLGKTVTTQYASFDSPPTLNPWKADRTPGGSSTGSAAGLACGMMFGALGSQTGGSITRPASYCGVAGCKPTHGRVSADGVVPLSPSMDHPGPMARSVRDLAIMLQVMAGPDPRDHLCQNRPVPDYTVRLNGTLPPPRLGRVRGLFEERADPAVRAMMDRVTDELRKAGAVIVEVGLPAGFQDVVERHKTIMGVEGAAYHEVRLRRHPDDYLPKVRGLFEAGLACPAPEFARAKEHQRQLTHDVLACFEGVDALLAPATTSPPPDASTTGDPAFQMPWSYTGVPTVSFLAGWTADALPLAIQVVSRPWTEAELLAVAAWCEAALKVEQRLPPA